MKTNIDQAGCAVPLNAGETSHTPTPWTQRISDNGAVDIVHKTDFICTVGVLPYDGNILEDAAFIVRACNEYATLKAKAERAEALEGALRVISEIASKSDPKQMNMMALVATFAAIRDEAAEALSTQPAPKGGPQ